MRTESTREIGDGKKCDDCSHIKRCLELGYTTLGRHYCDFFPVRFIEKEVGTCQCPHCEKSVIVNNYLAKPLTK